ncbi:MAG: hypothetical protein J7K00_02300 [Candidatus Diapherotrites archaeon]|nr:hypothetical protein [Candidatus Diapherotrites archaeon]
MEQKSLTVVLVFLAVLIVGSAACYLGYLDAGTPKESPASGGASEEECGRYSELECPSACAVCPPCKACSSISCHSVDFCEEIGFSKDWYQSLAD